MSKSLDSGSTGPLSTTTGYLRAIRLKAANKSIFRALLSLSSAALLIRVMGMVNQVVVTYRFGQGKDMDAYFVASSIPFLLAQLLASGIESSVIPVYTRIRSKGTKEQASALFSTLLNLLVIGGIFVTIIMLIIRRQVIIFGAPALDRNSIGLAIGLAPYIFPVLVLMVLNSFMECFLNSEGQFGWPAYAGMLVPLTVAMLVLVAGKSQGAVMLCIGTIIGQLLQLFVIMIRARRSKIRYRPVIKLRSPELAATLSVAWPSLMAALISQASPLVDQMFASPFPLGSISALNYALKLISVPSGVIFLSVARAALPYLSQQAANHDMKAFKGTLRLYIWAVGIGTILLTAFMIVLAHPIVRILFQRGAFTAADTSRTSTTLIGFVIGLLPMAVGFVAVKAFSALGKTRVLMYITIFSIFANAIFDAIFAHFWQIFGIALATSAVYTCTMCIILFTLRRTIGSLQLFTPPAELLSLFGKLGLGLSPAQQISSGAESSFSIPYALRQQLIRNGVALAVFAVGIAGVIINATYTLRAALGSIVIVALLRYRYVLLIIWVLINAFIGSSLPFFNGNNFLSGLTVPTLLLLFYFPTKKTFKRMPALLLLLVYLLWVLAGIGISPIGTSAFLTLWTTFLDYVAIGVLTINVLSTRRHLKGLIDAFLLVSIFISLYGIYGYFTKHNGVADTQIATIFRISSIFGKTPTALAMFLSMVIPVSIFRAFTLQGFKRIGGAIMVIIFLITLGLTYTRGAFISVFLSIVVMILLLPSRKLRIGMLGGISALVAAGALVLSFSNVQIFSRFFSEDVITLNGRTYLWEAVISHFDPTQLLGNGLTASDVLLSNLHIGPGRGLIGSAPHNLFLGTLFDHGAIGFLLLTLVFISLFVILFAGMRKASGEQRALYTVSLAVLVSMLVQSFESNEIWNQAIGIYFWIIMSLPFALCWLTAKQPVATREEFIDEEKDVDATEPRIKIMEKPEPKYDLVGTISGRPDSYI